VKRSLSAVKEIACSWGLWAIVDGLIESGRVEEVDRELQNEVSRAGQGEIAYFPCRRRIADTLLLQPHYLGMHWAPTASSRLVSS
jgi:hypothetical protein